MSWLRIGRCSMTSGLWSLGSVVDLADVFSVSRPTVYRVLKRTAAKSDST